MNLQPTVYPRKCLKFQNEELIGINRDRLISFGKTKTIDDINKIFSIQYEQRSFSKTYD